MTRYSIQAARDILTQHGYSLAQFGSDSDLIEAAKVVVAVMRASRV